MTSEYCLPLLSGYTYHIYNQGNNKENIFKQPANYLYFLKKYQQYIAPFCDTYAYCLLPNHFHLLLQFKPPKALHQALPKRFPKPTVDNTDTIDKEISVLLSRQFQTFFSTYAKAINKRFNRSGSLFSANFKRIIVDSPSYFEHLVIYIHRNPVHHHFCSNYTDWAFSSYWDYINGGNTWMATDFVYQWFGSLEQFLVCHQLAKEAYLDASIYLE